MLTVLFGCKFCIATTQHRPCVGDRVLVTDASTHLMGAVGTVLKDGHDRRPFVVQLDGGMSDYGSGCGMAVEGLADALTSSVAASGSGDGTVAYLREAQIIRLDVNRRPTSPSSQSSSSFEEVAASVDYQADHQAGSATPRTNSPGQNNEASASAPATPVDPFEALTTPPNRTLPLRCGNSNPAARTTSVSEGLSFDPTDPFSIAGAPFPRTTTPSVFDTIAAARGNLIEQLPPSTSSTSTSPSSATIPPLNRVSASIPTPKPTRPTAIAETTSNDPFAFLDHSEDEDGGRWQVGGGGGSKSGVGRFVTNLIACTNKRGHNSRRSDTPNTTATTNNSTVNDRSGIRFLDEVCKQTALHCIVQP